MCGIAGLSVGCALADFCTKGTESAACDDGFATGRRASNEFTAEAGLGRWDERASVRVAPRRLLAEPEATENTQIFPAHMVPILSSYEGSARWPVETRHAIAVQHLFRYLSFTVHLETAVVNPVLLAMVNGQVGVPLSPSTRLDALRMYTDEAYHALAAVDIGQQVARSSAVVDRTQGLAGRTFSHGLRRVVQASGAPELSRLHALMFVIVSETLISSNLREIASDSELADGVSDTLGDHARDEGRHHAFFAQYLKALWPSLDPSTRREVALRIPDLIEVFFAPEVEDVAEELRELGVRKSDRDAAMEAAYGQDVVRASAAASSTRLVRYLTELGALESPEVYEHYAARGLVGSDTRSAMLSGTGS